MSKFKTMVRNDIMQCNDLIEKGFATKCEVRALLGKYMIDYPNFQEGIINYVTTPGHENNEIENIKIIKNKLQYLLNRGDNQNNNNYQNTPEISISTVNNNTNIVQTITSINDIRENINDNTYLSSKEKKELLLKLDEIIELQKSKDSKTVKWNKAKKIMEFILDKGADIAIMYIPQIIKAISN